MYLREFLVYVAIALSLVIGSAAFIFQYKGVPDLWFIKKNPDLETKHDPVNGPHLIIRDSSYAIGMDISHWDGTIKWSFVKKSGIQFAYIKATEGSEYVDPKFRENWEGSKDANILRGAYHFYLPKVDPRQQAKHFAATVVMEIGDLPPVLDIEISSGVTDEELSKNILICLESVEQLTGHKPMIYTDNGFWDAHITGSFEQYDLWIADWQAKKSPVLPPGWSDWKFWQHSIKGRVKGIRSTSIDLDHYHGSIEELKREIGIN